MFLPSNITLKFGDSGDFVAELQRRLARVNCFTEDQVNGFYDGNTVNGVTSFQAREGLHADGVAGPETLRRLNGVIAGDTSSSSGDKKEDEAAKSAAQQSLTNDMLSMGLSPAPDPFAYTPPVHAPYGEEAYQQPVAAIAPEPLTQQPNALAQEQQRMNDQMQRDLAMQPPSPPPPSPEEMLARMQQQVAGLTPPPKGAEQAHAPQPQHPQHPPQQAEPQQAEPPKAELPKAELPKELAAAPKEEAAKESEKSAEPKTIGGRIRHFANAMIQKLADHFESKLPPSVLKEVQSIGVAMAQSGMKEAPIPTGPELPTRSPELPTRGPEPAQQRG
jgi:hypothetical protein